MQNVVSCLVCNYIDGGGRAGCCNLIILWISYDCLFSLAPSHIAIGGDALSDCGIS